MKTIKNLGGVYKKYHYLIIGDVGINEKDNMYIDGLHYDFDKTNRSNGRNE